MDAIDIHQIPAKSQIKKCYKCEIEKPISSFSKNKRKKNGINNECKKCSSVRSKSYYLKNKKMLNEKNRKYYKLNSIKIIKRTGKYNLDNKELTKERYRLYYLKNKHVLSEKSKKYYSLNKDKKNIQNKIYREKNKEKIRIKHHEYYEENKETHAMLAKQYRKKHKKEIANARKLYLKTDTGKESIHRYNHKRRTLKYGVGYEIFNIKDVFERDNYICQHCGKKTRPTFNHHHPMYPNLDHIIPISKSGPHTRLNTQCLCHRCNTNKGNDANGEQLRLFG